MNNKGSGWKLALLVLSLGVVAALVMDFNSRTAELHRLTAEKELVTNRLDGLKATRVFLEGQIAYATSLPAVVQWAYGEGHMAKPGDAIVVPIQSGTSLIIPTPTPIFQPTPVDNFESWRDLLLGPSSP